MKSGPSETQAGEQFEPSFEGLMALLGPPSW